MADEMTRRELVAALTGLETRLIARTDQLEQSMNERFAKVDERFTKMDAHINRVDEQFKEIHAQFARVTTDMNEQFSYVKVQFEQVRGDIRFGLEGRESLRETMERRFDEARERDESQHDLLKQVLHHVRGRVENLEKRHDSSQR